MPRKTLLLATLFLLFITACSPPISDDPVAVIQQYFDYWNNEDIDGIMSMLDDEPEIEVDLGVILTDKGKIQETFEKLFQRVDFQITVSDFKVNENTVTYNYQIFVGDELNEQGRSQAVVVNGKIKSEKYIGPYAP
ncbi:MAG TPA: nuclear transport factor 2 family protein [Anaerolineales bacterium]|nr:nuclear transport factor 2 family protein [Anaerolineales bacterium]